MEDKDINGILVVDKPRGITSHDVVNIVRRLFKIKKVGHAGTLDPIATGVLIILIGKATKMSNLFANNDKAYVTRMRLGITTDTGDAFGRVINTSEIQGLGRDFVEKTILSFKGEIEQVPPMFSATKFKGRSLYKWARKGITIPRKARKVTIRDISVKEITQSDVVFDVLCSKGTYIRQLCVDIGKRLGCGAHMTELRRLKAGDFHISQAIDFCRLRSMTEENLFDSVMSFK